MQAYMQIDDQLTTGLQISGYNKYNKHNKQNLGLPGGLAQWNF